MIFSIRFICPHICPPAWSFPVGTGHRCFVSILGSALTTPVISMGHYCRICGRIRANEKFSGRGHRARICKDCQRRPLGECDRIMCTDELCGDLDQSHISQKNIERLGILTRHADPDVRRLAALVLEVARVKPHKRRRLKFLAQNHPSLLLRLKAEYGGDLPDGDG